MATTVVELAPGCPGGPWPTGRRWRAAAPRGVGVGAKCRILGGPFTDYGPGSVPAGARAAPGPGGLAPPGCWLIKKDAAYC